MSEAARRSSGSALLCAIESSLEVATAARNQDLDVDMRAGDGGVGLDDLDRHAQMSVAIHGPHE